MMSVSPEKMQAIIEAALMVAGHPLTIAALQNLFPEEDRPDAAIIKTLLNQIQERHADSGIELHEVSSGFRIQAKAELSPWLAKLWEERAPRYSRAFLETLSIIAYKQPITRAEIEEIRGVTVSSNIVKTLMEREWIRIIGHKEIPGRPAIFGTTRTFLDHFGLKSLSDLPSLAEFKDIETQEAQLQVQLAIENSGLGPENSEMIPQEREAILLGDDDMSQEMMLDAELMNDAGMDHESVIELIDESTMEVVAETEEQETEEHSSNVIDINIASDDETNEAANG